MNNRYFGNIHDFCKYGLLRLLAEHAALGVCWMLTPPSGKSESGYEYLSRGHLRHCDPALFDWLKDQRDRWVREGMDERLWGMGLLARDELIPRAKYFPKDVPAVVAERDEYFRGMIAQFQQSDRNLVFLDPDFGLGLTARELVGERGNGYLRACEVARCFHEGFSVLFYQDWRPNFEEEPARKIREALRRERVRARILEFAANAAFRGQKAEETGGTRARFFLVQNPAHSAEVQKFTGAFRRSEWCMRGPFIAPRVRVGVFIDGENTYSTPKIRHVLDGIRSIVPHGEAVYGRIFGKPDAIGRERRKLADRYPYFARPCEVGAGDDEAEVAMSADINDKVGRGEVDAVIVFAKDKLNRPSARFARNRGIPFYGIGDLAGSALEYRRECEKFFSVIKDDGGNFGLKEI